MLNYIFYYDEPAMLVFMLILVIAWGVLNIILFFKLWRACDDIKRMASKYSASWSDLLLLGRKEEAADMVIRELLAKLNRTYKSRLENGGERLAENPGLYSDDIKRAKHQLSIIKAGVLPPELDNAEAFIAWKRKF